MKAGMLATLALALGSLAGCGGGSSGSSSSSSSSASVVPSSPAAASTEGAASKADAVALISSTPIAKSSYEHWLMVEKALGAAGNPAHQALGFLISSDWVIAEAAGRGISVSEAEVKQHLAASEHQSFPKAGSLQKFIARSHETEADLLAREKVELLEQKIAAKVAAGKRGAQRKALLASFQKAFQHHWRSYTTCTAGYVMEDCTEYRGKPEHLAASSSSSGASKSGSGPGSSAASAAAGSSGSTGAAGTGSGSAPGVFSVASPAFANGGALPAQYTCDGTNISPPVQWSNLPAKTAALVLFMIDDTTTGPAGGVRWIVGDISPSATGIAAGKLPAGAIVGSYGPGHSGYGGICPPRGKTSTIEFELYPLSRKIPLTPGFQPATAEREYGAGNLLRASAAVSYATYRRR